MLKLAILLADAGISGGVNVIFQHAVRLAKRDVQVWFVSEQRVCREDVIWHNLMAQFHQPNLHWASFKDVANERFDLALATYWETYFDLWKIDAKKYLYFVQSIESRFFPRSAHVQRSVVEATYELPIGIITEARWIVDYLYRRHGHFATLVPNGIDKELFMPQGPVVKPRQGGCLRVLVEGPFNVPFKNVPKTIELCRAANVDEIWLLTSSKVDQVEGVDRIFCQIPIAATPEVYRSCDILVKLSYVEGMFGPPLEMFHCGGTCLVYDVTGHDEYIEDGVNGFIVKTNDESGVVSRLNQLKAFPELLSHLKVGAIATARQWIDWDRSNVLFFDALDATARGTAVTRTALERHSRRIWHFYESARRENERLQKELIERTAEVEQLKAALDAIRESSSWRVTAPGRHIASVSRKLARKGRRVLSLGLKLLLWTATLQLRTRLQHVREQQRARKLIVASGLFDSDWYLASYPDVARAGINPVDHYLRYGVVEGRNPSPHFDTLWYLEKYPDITVESINPLVHYIKYGVMKGRQPCPDRLSNI